MTSSREQKDREVELSSPHGDYTVTVGYDFDLDGYYVLLHQRSLSKWNERIFELMGDLQFDDPFDAMRLHSLYEATVTSLLDNSLESKGPLAIDDVMIILGIIATTTHDDLQKISNLSNRRH